MTKGIGALNSQYCGRLLEQLTELAKSDSSLTDRLFRCRQILEDIFKALTSQTNIAFTGLYARMQYVYEESIITTELNEQLQLLRLLTNKVIHRDDFNFGESDFYSAIKILFNTICSLCGSSIITPELNAFVKEKKAKNLMPAKTPVESTISHLFGIVTEWKCSTSKESNKYIDITCQSSDGNEISVTLWERADYSNSGRKWTSLNKTLWKYCNISFYNLSLVHGNVNRFQSTPLTLIVLEQDFLVDVSSIAECFQQKECYPELFILNKFFSEPISLPLAKGKCVNHVFDELVNDPKRDLKDIFDEYLSQNPLSVFSLGNQAWQEIYTQIEQDHYPQLKEMAINLSRKKCQLEPSFLAVKYGLHGRLDVMTIPDEHNEKYSILELKSGSAPGNDVWKGHQMQVVGYNLILKEVFGLTNVASSSIFYSRSSTTPLRHVVNHITIEQDFMMCRNRIIGLLSKMATQPESLMDWLKDIPHQYSNEFITEKARKFSSTLNSLAADEYRWLNESLGFIFREIWAVKTGLYCDNDSSGMGFSALWNSSLAEKKKQYRIIDGLWIDSINDDIIVFHRQDDNALSNLREGDIIVLYKQMISLKEQQLIRGTIKFIGETTIEIRTRSKIKAEGVFDCYTLWAIEPDLMESSLYGGLTSIYTLLSSEIETRSKLLGYLSPEFEESKIPKLLSWRTDIAESLKGMISAKDYYLIQGPPGTGKTSCLLMQYVIYTMSETEKTILILAYTNRAVDEICCHLQAENIEYIRLGGSKSDKDCYLAKDSKPCNHKVIYLNPASLYENNRIFVSTMHSFCAVATDLLNKITIDELIIDEASQILEHHIVGLMSRIRKTILIGDQNQLPPIILQHTEHQKVSILEKLIVNADKRIFPICYSMLTYHYRMHNDIARLISDYYQNKLIADSKRQKVSSPWLQANNEFLEPILKARLVWIDTPPSLQSKADILQAEWIKQFLESLNNLMPTEDICSKIGVITPFRAQAQCIISALGAKYKGLTVDTVERYQGSQRDCIIMSYPVKHQYELSLFQSINQIGTIDRKLNVALSRAREQLIILGSSKLLVHSEFFHKVYTHIKQSGVIISLKTLDTI